MDKKKPRWSIVDNSQATKSDGEATNVVESLIDRVRY